MVKRILEMESDFRKVSSYVDKVGMIARRFENENVVIWVEIEVFKLSELELLTVCIEVMKKEKKWLKRFVVWEK